MSPSNSPRFRQFRRGQLQSAALMFLLSFAVLPSRATAAPSAESRAVRFAAELTDGTNVTGELVDLDALPLTVDFGEVKIPLRLIHGVQIGQGDSPAKVRFRNGDLLSGRLGLETLVLSTKYGRLSIKVQQIVRITSAEAASIPTERAAIKSGIMHYDDQTWSDKTLKSSTVTVVTAWAPWAAPCVKTLSMLTKTAGDYQGKLRFVMLDIDRGKKTAKKLGITALPTMLIYRDGKLLEKRIGGFTEEDALRQWLDAIYKKHRKRPQDDNPFG